uniref:Uncharacterized protein n=1 Tax=Treubia lacunosa TaxID=93845 RepID=G4Y9W5_9MARC|nr:hypothetical protein TrlaMp67 [Treubia lacunosa]AEH99762.1 hypothetical protein TrlaMp67 [Treubia lacunosa]
MEWRGWSGQTTHKKRLYPVPPPSVECIASVDLLPIALVHGNCEAISSLRTLLSQLYQPFLLVTNFFLAFTVSLETFSIYSGLGAFAGWGNHSQIETADHAMPTIT